MNPAELGERGSAFPQTSAQLGRWGQAELRSALLLQSQGSHQEEEKEEEEDDRHRKALKSLREGTCMYLLEWPNIDFSVKWYGNGSCVNSAPRS